MGRQTERTTHLTYICWQRVVADVDVFSEAIDDSSEWRCIEERHRASKDPIQKRLVHQLKSEAESCLNARFLSLHLQIAMRFYCSTSTASLKKS